MGKNGAQENGLTQWQDVPNNGSIDDFARQTKLNPQLLKLTDPGVIILPNNMTLAEPPKDKNLFTQSTKNILAILNHSGMHVRLYDDTKEKRELILDSADIILPILLFLGPASVSVGLGVLANWISFHLMKTDTKPPSLKVEYAEIDQNETIVRWRRIEGSAPDVQRLLSEESKALNENNSTNQIEISPTESMESKIDKERHKNSADIALDSANKLILEAESFLSKNELAVAESLFRKSLVNIREALLWEPEELSHSKYLHMVGHRIHDIFECPLEFKDGQYWVTCPVMLSHGKGGFSIGGTGKAICSICGINVFDCPHVNGQIYDSVVANHNNEFCNICGKRECKHMDGMSYDSVQAFNIITELDLDHIAFVTNPANPLCTFNGYSMSKSDLLKTLPESERKQVVYGQTVIHCHHCLLCKGV